MTPEQASAELELIGIEKERRRRAVNQSKQDDARRPDNIAEAKESARMYLEPSFGERALGTAMGAADAMSMGAADEVRGMSDAMMADGKGAGVLKLLASSLLGPAGMAGVPILERIRNSDAYDAGRQKQNAASEAYQEAVPGSYLAGQTTAQVGELALGAPKALASAAIPKLQLLGRGAGLGAATGATGGALQGDGGEGRLRGGAVGGLVGAALGGLPGAAAVLPGAGSRLRLEAAKSTPQSQARLLENVPVLGKPLATARRALADDKPVGGDYAAMMREQLAEGPMQPGVPRLTPTAPPRPTASPPLQVDGPPRPSSSPPLQLEPKPAPPPAPVAGPAGAPAPPAPSQPIAPPAPPQAAPAMDIDAFNRANPLQGGVTMEQLRAAMPSAPPIPRAGVGVPKLEAAPQAQAQAPGTDVAQTMMQSATAKMPLAPPAAPKLAKSPPLGRDELKAAVEAGVAKGIPLKTLAKQLGLSQGDIGAFYKGAQLGPQRTHGQAR
jgi:hypothetical protein